MSRFHVKIIFIALALIFILSPHISYSATFGSSNSASYKQGIGLNRNLVAWWTFDASDVAGTQVYDKSGQNNTGTITDGVIKATGKLGQAMKFNPALNGKITAAAISAVTKGGTYSFSAWLKPADVTASQCIFQNSPAGDDRNGLSMQDGTIRFGYYNGNAWSGASGAISANRWTHVVGINNGGTLSIYLNGVKQTGSDEPYVSVDSSLWLGLIPGPINPYNGLMDDIRVYSRALSASEVKQLYAQGSSAVVGSNQLAGKSYAVGGLNSGLVGYWTFDAADVAGTQVYDRSGQGTVGTMTGGITKTIGKLGQALNFNGTSDYINLGSSSVYAIAGDLSLSAWIYPTNVDADRHAPIISKRHGYSLYLFPGNGTTSYLEYEGFNGTDWGNNFYSNSAVITKNRWQHVAVSFAATSTATLYVNGVAVGSKATAGGHGLFYENLLIGWGGSQEWGTPPYFAGKIDDVRIYNRAISASEVKQLYAQGSSAVVGSNLTSGKSYATGGLNSGLVGYWTFDATDVSGTKAYDKTTNNNTGTATGGITKAIGKLGQALKFDGTNGNIDIGNTTSLRPQGEITISGWFKTSDISTEQMLVSMYPNWSLEVYQSKLTFQITGYKQSATPLSSNKWYHFAATYNESTVRFYVDGQSDGAYSFTEQLGNDGAPHAYIGTYPLGGLYWNGPMDDVRIYSRVLSAAEIQQLYQMGK